MIPTDPGNRPRASGSTSLGRKARTADCRKCGIWSSLVEAGLPAPTVQATCQQMWLHVARQGQVLFLEGNQAQHLYVIRSGTVKLVKTDASGREHVAAVLGRGSLLGLEAAFDAVYSTGAEAHSDCELCLLTAEDLRDLMHSVPSFSLDIARCLHGRLVDAHKRLAFLGNPGARARLAGYLLWQLPEDRSEPRLVRHDLTQRELGGVLGLSPETVCRTLGAFRTEGVIAVDAKQITVLDREELDRLAAG